jgi:hypothetical protein
MLDNGLIQHSSNPFSSHVLLVKKKDKSYRFYVDYRHLNTITAKGQFPAPVIDDFLDELQQASWFSCLDLCSGVFIRFQWHMKIVIRLHSKPTLGIVNFVLCPLVSHVLHTHFKKL